jgi:hypothetical protein
MPAHIPQGDLSRAKTHEPEDEYPTMIEIVAWWGHGGRKGKRRSLEVPADQFFGRGAFGAPLSGDQLVGMINQLRKQD